MTKRQIIAIAFVFLSSLHLHAQEEKHGEANITARAAPTHHPLDIRSRARSFPPSSELVERVFAAARHGEAPETRKAALRALSAWSKEAHDLGALADSLRSLSYDRAAAATTLLEKAHLVGADAQPTRASYEKLEETIVEELGARLETDPEPDVRREALLSLSKLKGHAKNGAAAILKALADRDSSVRLQAAHLIHEIKQTDPRDLPRLLSFLDSDNRTQRVEAIRLVGSLGENAGSVVPKLRELLHSPESGTFETAAGALARIGKASEAAVPDLVLLLGKPRLDRHSRYILTSALADIGSETPAAVNRLVDLSFDPATSEPATRGLSRLPHPEGDALEALLEASAHEDGLTRLASIDGLEKAMSASPGAARDRQILERLRKLATTDRIESVRGRASVAYVSRSLASQRPAEEILKEKLSLTPDTVMKLVQAANEPRVREQALRILANLLPGAKRDVQRDILRRLSALYSSPWGASLPLPLCEPLAGAFAAIFPREEEPREIRDLILRLTRHWFESRDPKALPIFGQLTHTGYPLGYYALSGVANFAHARDPRALPILLSVTEEQDFHREWEVAPLIAIYGPAALPTLRRALGSASAATRRTALMTLRLAAWGADAIPDVIPHLSDASPLVRAQAAYTLSFHGEASRKAIPLLRQLEEDADADVQRAASHAVATIDGGEHGAASLLRLAGRGDQGLDDALEIAGARRDAAARRVIVMGLRNSFPETRARARQFAGGHVKSPEVIRTLAHLMRTQRGEGATLLAQAGADAKLVLPDILAILDDEKALSLDFPSFNEAAGAAVVAGAIGPEAPELAPKLVRLLDKPNIVIRLEGAKALGKMGAVGAPHTRAVLKSLERAQFDTEYAALLGALRDFGPAARKWAPESPHLVGKLLEHGDVSVRRKAAKTLAAIEEPRLALPALRALEQKEVVPEVKKELGRIIHSLNTP